MSHQRRKARINTHTHTNIAQYTHKHARTHLLEFQQGCLCGVAVYRIDLLGAVDEQVERVAAAGGQREAHIAAVDVHHLGRARGIEHAYH